MPSIEQIQPSPASLASRLPEVATIDGYVGREVARIFIEDVPPYFWLARASKLHHPPDERGLGGTWLHTKRVYTAYRMLEPTYRSMSAIGPYEANCARAAVLLHDAFKYGQTPAQESSDTDDDDVGHDYAGDVLSHLPAYTVPAHDVQMAEFVRDNTRLPDEVAQYVEAHGGSTEWYGHEGPPPQTDAQMLVHTADVLASNANHRLPVWRPTLQLQNMTGDVPAIDTDAWEL